MSESVIPCLAHVLSIDFTTQYEMIPLFNGRFLAYHECSVKIRKAQLSVWLDERSTVCQCVILCFLFSSVYSNSTGFYRRRMNLAKKNYPGPDLPRRYGKDSE